MLQTILLVFGALLIAKALLIGSEFNFILWIRNWKDYPNWYFSRETWQQYCLRNSKEKQTTQEATWILPWNDRVFDGWYICGINHYWDADEKRIAISMAKNRGRQTISASGVDDEFIWDDLAKKIKELQ